MVGNEEFDGGLDVARAYYVMVLRDLLPPALGCHLVSIRGSDPVELGQCRVLARAGAQRRPLSARIVAQRG